MTHNIKETNPYYRNPGEDWSKYWVPGTKWTRNPSFSEQPRGRKQPRRLFRHSPFMQRHPHQTRIDMHMINQGNRKKPSLSHMSTRPEWTEADQRAEDERNRKIRQFFTGIPSRIGGLLESAFSR